MCVDVLCECVSVVALGSLVTSGGSHWEKNTNLVLVKVTHAIVTEEKQTCRADLLLLARSPSRNVAC